MTGIDILKNDHRNVEQLFAQFLQLEEPAEEREALFQQIQTELAAHTTAEETVFYPAVQAEIPDQIDKALNDHEQVKEMLAELLNLEFEDEQFDTKFTSMMKAVQQHVEEEERSGGIMDIASQKLDSEMLASMVNEIETAKRDVQGEMAA